MVPDHRGVKAFGSGDTEEPGGKFYAINVAYLNDAMDERLALAPVAYKAVGTIGGIKPPPKPITYDATRGYERRQGGRQGR